MLNAIRRSAETLFFGRELIGRDVFKTKILNELVNS